MIILINKNITIKFYNVINLNKPPVVNRTSLIHTFIVYYQYCVIDFNNTNYLNEGFVGSNYFFRKLPHILLQSFFSTYSKMKSFNQENLNQQSEQITYLLTELNSTLDLYYEKSIDTNFDSNDP